MITVKLIIGGAILVVFLVGVAILSIGLITSREKPDPAIAEQKKKERSVADKIKAEYSLDEESQAKTVHTVTGDLTSVERRKRKADNTPSFAFSQRNAGDEVNIDIDVDIEDDTGYADVFKL